MANIAKWNAPALSTILSTELNSLGNNTMSAASATISSAVDMYVDFEVNLASLSPAANAFVAIYILLAVDGSNFPAQSDADLRLTTTQLFDVIPTGTTASTAQRIASRRKLLPPGSYQFKLDNQTGVSLNASGNTLKANINNVNLNA